MVCEVAAGFPDYANILMVASNRPNAEFRLNCSQRIARALKHPIEAVRVQAAKTLSAMADARCDPIFSKLLDESSPVLLDVAANHFARGSHPAAYEELERLTGRSGFRKLNDKLLERCFEALVKSNPKRGVEYIRRSVLGWGFCLGREAIRFKGAALRALRFADTVEAMVLLQRFAERRRSPLSVVAQGALRSPPAESEPEHREAQHA